MPLAAHCRSSRRGLVATAGWLAGIGEGSRFCRKAVCPTPLEQASRCRLSGRWCRLDAFDAVGRQVLRSSGSLEVGALAAGRNIGVHSTRTAVGCAGCWRGREGVGYDSVVNYLVPDPMTNPLVTTATGATLQRTVRKYVPAGKGGSLISSFAPGADKCCSP